LFISAPFYAFALLLFDTIMRVYTFIAEFVTD